MQIFNSASILIFLVACLGASLGSFITLLSYRLPRDEPIGMTRSRCPTCKTSLGIPDLFPILSWTWQRAKCRHCKTKIHWRYPATECVTAMIFTIIWLQFGLGYTTLIFMLLATLLLTLIIIDFEHYIIPDELQIALALLALPYRLLVAPTSFAEILAGLAVGLGTGWALQTGYRLIRKKHGLGTGDVKFLAVAGLWLGAEGLVSFFVISGLLGVIIGITWQICGFGKKFPFGPALAITLFLQLMYPQYTNILTWLHPTSAVETMP